MYRTVTDESRPLAEVACESLRQREVNWRSRTVNKDFPESCPGPGRICRMLLKTGCQARRRKPEGLAMRKGNNAKDGMMEWNGKKGFDLQLFAAAGVGAQFRLIERPPQSITETRPVGLQQVPWAQWAPCTCKASAGTRTWNVLITQYSTALGSLRSTTTLIRRLFIYLPGTHVGYRYPSLVDLGRLVVA